MTKKSMLFHTITSFLLLHGGLAIAQDQTSATSQTQVHGKELMTEQERAAHQQKMQQAKTEQEREQIRKQQHEMMQQRASEQGLSMPDEPPARGSGMGSGGGGKGR